MNHEVYVIYLSHYKTDNHLKNFRFEGKKKYININISCTYQKRKNIPYFP